MMTINSYPRILEEIPKQFSKRAHQVKSKFTKEEDERLEEAVKTHGTLDWGLVAKCVGNRTPRQCRERWNNYVNPKLVQTPWSDSEDALLFQTHFFLGNNWRAIEQYFPNRSKNNIKNRWSLLRQALPFMIENMRKCQKTESFQNFNHFGSSNYPIKPPKTTNFDCNTYSIHTNEEKIDSENVNQTEKNKNVNQNRNNQTMNGNKQTMNGNKQTMNGNKQTMNGNKQTMNENNQTMNENNNFHMINEIVDTNKLSNDSNWSHSSGIEKSVAENTLGQPKYDNNETTHSHCDLREPIKSFEGTICDLMSSPGMYCSEIGCAEETLFSQMNLNLSEIFTPRNGLLVDIDQDWMFNDRFF
ncbi:hypothetical protein TRFO_35683 [Tritrichomonas foetus]|uniref:Myb-like DNA-binding domain containing protein n=1 Tax=Tritrichomonas foetus TaxID=1144522 RepID=A0A1J4JKA8_9EUKA|nr:hypothetical protein TRFO_35683 [Tritrichomonas foetus]|eukprot:OHS98005.1 hypothetical protein TRFO_35683 [Tritrichomonas foetus]